MKPIWFIVLLFCCVLIAGIEIALMGHGVQLLGKVTSNRNLTLNYSALYNVSVPPVRRGSTVIKEPGVPCNNTVPFKSRPIVVNLTSPSWERLATLTKRLEPGGRFKPNCTGPDRVAIVVPYREREGQLRVLLQNLHPFLQRQPIQYGLYIIELAPNVMFNRALLMNIGYVEASKRDDYQCFIFHDVDLIPEDDANWYTCPKQPRHMSVAVDKFNYRLPYAALFGGVSALTKEHFEKVNGFSNLFFGWGGEDDEMMKRVSDAGLKVTRYSVTIARYKMIKHIHEASNQANPQRMDLINTSSSRRGKDGLNSMKYSVLSVDNSTSLYTRILVNFTKADYGL